MFTYFYSDRTQKMEVVDEIPQQTKHINGFHQVIENNPLTTAKEEIKKEEIREEKKKTIVGTGNLLDMISWYDRVRGKREVRKNVKEPPRHDPKDSFRWDINRIVRMVEEEKAKKLSESYLANMDNVLNHLQKQNA